VVRLADFGAFVNLSPGIDGLVHVSEADLRPVRHVRDVLKVGQPVDVVILSVDREKRRISLSIKDALAADQAAQPEFAGGEGEAATAGVAGIGTGGLAGASAGTGPGAAIGRQVLRNPAAGDLAEGYVAGIKPYGLFVDLPAYGHRARGLVPFEETGEKAGTDLARRFHIGDALRVEVLEVDTEGKIRLSLTRARDRAAQVEFDQYRKSAGPAKTADTAMAEALRRAMEGRRK
jgi:ribosomal protein S1